jgi:hypothetical protein
VAQGHSPSRPAATRQQELSLPLAAPHVEFTDGVEGRSGRRGNGENVGEEILGANVSGGGGRLARLPVASSPARRGRGRVLAPSRVVLATQRPAWPHSCRPCHRGSLPPSSFLLDAADPRRRCRGGAALLWCHRGVLLLLLLLGAGSEPGEHEFEAEVDTISRVHHQHLVALVGSYIDSACWCSSTSSSATTPLSTNSMARATRPRAPHLPGRPSTGVPPLPRPAHGLQSSRCLTSARHASSN